MDEYFDWIGLLFFTRSVGSSDKKSDEKVFRDGLNSKSMSFSINFRKGRKNFKLQINVKEKKFSVFFHST